MSEADDVKRAQELARLRRNGQIDAGVERMLTLLEQAQREIQHEVLESEWDRFYLPHLAAAVDRHLEHWRDLALQHLTGEQAALWALGAEDTVRTLAAMGAAVRMPELPTSLLRALQEQAGQRVGHLTRSAKERLDKTIALSLLTGQSREEAIRAIGKVLATGTTTGKPQGLFGSLGARAAFIYQHEVGQAFALAQDLRRQDVLQYALPGLQKVWRHAGHPKIPRPSHIAMHAQVREQDEPFMNPRTGAELMYPRDPEADIKETAGCTCDVVLWRPEYGDLLEFIGPATTGPSPVRRASRERAA